MDGALYLPSFSATKLKSLLVSEFFNYDLQKQLTEILNVILTDNEVGNNVRMKKYLTFPRVQNLYNLLEGFMIVCGINEVTDFFLIQTTLTKTRDDIFLNGDVQKVRRQINELRKEIPNYQFFYSMTDHVALKVDVGDVIGWTERHEEFKEEVVVFSENLGITLKEFIKGCSKEEYLQVICQAFLAFETFQKNINNYESSGKLFVKELPNPVDLYYKTGNVILRSKYILMIDHTGGTIISSKKNYIDGTYPIIKIGAIIDSGAFNINDPVAYVPPFAKDLHIIFEQQMRNQIVGLFRKKGRKEHDYPDVRLNFLNMIAGFSGVNFLFPYNGQSYSNCAVVPCVQKNALISIAPNNISFGDMYDLFEYIVSGGIITKDDIGYEKRVDFRELTRKYKERFSNNMENAKVSLQRISIPAFFAINNPTFSQQENLITSWKRYMLELKQQHISFTRAFDIITQEINLVEVFIYLSRKLGQKTVQTAEEILSEIKSLSSMALQIQNNIKLAAAPGANFVNSSNMIVYFDSEYEWVLKHLLP